MARRVQVWLLGAVALSLTGCYAHHTADEEELEFAVPGEDASVGLPMGDPGALPAVADAGVAVGDAAVDCQTLPDLVQQLLCTATQSAQPGNPGAINIEDIIGGLLGGGRGRDAGMVGTGIGGQVTIEDLLGGLLDGGRNTSRDGGTGGAGGLGDLLGGASCLNPTDPFAQLICALTGAGRAAGRDGGASLGADPIGSLLDTLSEVQCRNATEGLTQLFCFFRDLSTRAARRDGGVPLVDASAQPGADDASVDAAADAATLEDAALPETDAALDPPLL